MDAFESEFATVLPAVVQYFRRKTNSRKKEHSYQVFELLNFSQFEPITKSELVTDQCRRQLGLRLRSKIETGKLFEPTECEMWVYKHSQFQLRDRSFRAWSGKFWDNSIRTTKHKQYWSFAVAFKKYRLPCTGSKWRTFLPWKWIWPGQQSALSQPQRFRECGKKGRDGFVFTIEKRKVQNVLLFTFIQPEILTLLK